MDLLVRGYSGYAPDIISNGCIFFGNSDGKKKPIALKTPYFHQSTFEQLKGAIDRQNEIIDPILFKMSLKYDLFTTESATEQDWAGVVESWPSVSGEAIRVYQRYPDEIPKCRTATASGHSLLASNGLEGNYAIVKRCEMG